MEGARGLVAVIGAGPAGAMAAHLLARKGREVLLLDDCRRSPDRMEMVPPGAAIALRAAGVGALLSHPEVAVPCLGILRKGAEDRQDFLSQPGGSGFAIHRPTLDAAIRTAAVAAGAHLLRGRLAAIEDLGNRFEIRLTATTRGSASIEAQTVIDASGRAAVVGRRLGGKITTWQHLIAEPVISDEGNDSWLCFSGGPDEWRYTMTGPGGRRDSWRVVVPIRGRKRSNVVDASARSLAPTAGPRWLAIGDAACAFDPICCQGLANAAGTALAAVGMIVQSGTVVESAAQAYSLACELVVSSTEMGRRGIYEKMRCIDLTEDQRPTAPAQILETKGPA
ncbi:NAD(P)/FAD-dependent oxidoreductase [Rhizobium beringeri]|uniref:NAD(P)/FAD-dependent oxidoreductase n=1 Tax=Rhizobium beringeri TaxID=3019934 RepID=UPI003CE8EB59